MRRFTAIFFLFSFFLTTGQEKRFLDSISNLETKLVSGDFIKAIIDIPYDKALEDTDLFLKLSEKAAAFSEEENNKEWLAESFMQVALAYHFSSKPDLSIDYNLKAAALFQKLNDNESFARCYLTLGWQIKNRDLQKGISFMNKGIRILENSNPSSENLKFGYNNYGVLKQRNSELDSALFFHQKALSLSIDQKDSISIPFALSHIAMVYLKKKSYTEAEANFLKALQIREKRKDIYGITDSYLYLGDLFYEKKDFKNAIFYFKKGDSLAAENSYFPLQKYANEYLYKSFKNQKNYEKALFYQEKFNSLKDSVLNKETNAKIAALQIEFETSEKERKIIAQELKIKNRNIILLYLISSIVLIAVVFYFITKKNQLKRIQLEKEISLKEELSQIKTKNKLQEQRLEISRDLHDNIGSQLTFIISSLDTLKFISKSSNKKVLDKLEEIGSFAKGTIDQLRDTIWAMNKEVINIEDLTIRFYSYIEKAKSVVNTNFEIENTVTSDFSFSSKTGIHLFRIIQEAINNGIKYSEAKTIVLKIEESDESLILEVSDNGIGFQMKEIELGNGLQNMESRAVQIGGKISIRSEIGTGTTIIVNIPKTTIN